MAPHTASGDVANPPTRSDSIALAHEILTLLDADEYGLTDRLLEAASPALDAEGRGELRRLLQARVAALPSTGARHEFDAWRGRFEPAWRLRQLADLVH